MLSSQGGHQEHPANPEPDDGNSTSELMGRLTQAGSVISWRARGRAAFLCHCRPCWCLPEPFVTNCVRPWHKSRHSADNFYHPYKPCEVSQLHHRDVWGRIPPSTSQQSLVVSELRNENFLLSISEFFLFSINTRIKALSCHLCIKRNKVEVCRVRI